MQIGDLARRWIAANFIAMVAMAAAILLAFGLRYSLDLGSVDAALSARICYVTAEIVMTTACLALYARLTGTVLRRIVPALPWRSWIAVHLVIGLTSGAVTGLAAAGPGGDSEPIDWTDPGFLVFVLFLMTAGGAAIGALVGGLQALILRRVADGAGAWVAFSALSVGVLVFIVAAALPFLPAGPTFAAEAATQGVSLFAGIVGAIVMLPALRRLRPRPAEG